MSFLLVCYFRNFVRVVSMVFILRIFDKMLFICTNRALKNRESKEQGKVPFSQYLDITITFGVLATMTNKTSGEEYRSEGISLERISFTDNRPVLDMFLQFFRSQADCL